MSTRVWLFIAALGACCPGWWAVIVVLGADNIWKQIVMSMIAAVFFRASWVAFDEAEK